MFSFYAALLSPRKTPFGSRAVKSTELQGVLSLMCLLFVQDVPCVIHCRVVLDGSVGWSTQAVPGEVVVELAARPSDLRDVDHDLGFSDPACV